MIEREIYNRLREIALLLAAGDQQILQPHQLTISQYETLFYLEPEVGFRMGELRSQILVDNAKMTRIVDYLEKQGWVTRQADAHDRRAQLVFITPSGIEKRAEVQIDHGESIRQRIPTAINQPQLLDTLNVIRAHLDLD